MHWSVSWFYLSIAIPCSVMGTLCMKLSCGFKKWRPVVLLGFFYTISFIALTFALRTLDVSIVYAIWSGVGTVLVGLLGVIVFKERISVTKVVSFFLVILGVIGIHLANVIHSV